MYTCVNAFLQSRTPGSRFVKRTVNTDAVSKLLSDNRVAVLVLTHPSLDHEISLDLTDAETLIYQAGPDVTVDQWLTSLGNASLPTNEVVPSVVQGVAKFNDIFNAGYTVKKVPSQMSDDSELPDSELRDIRLKKSFVDYMKAPSTALVTVNGLLHLMDASVEGIKIKEGGRSTVIANRHNLGLISFKQVGNITCVPLTADRIVPRNGTRLYDGILIKLPEYDLSNKVAMLSIGGYLHYNDFHYRTVGEHALALDWNRIPLQHRYFESRKLIDLSAFEKTLVRNVNHGDALDMSQAKADASILAYLTLSQSFVILLDVDNFHADLQALEKTQLPGRFYAYDTPSLPLLLETGLLPSYYAMEEGGMWSIAVEENFRNRYAHDTKAADSDPYANDALISQYPKYYGSGYFLEMGTERLEYKTA